MHVGISPTTIRTLRSKMEDIILKYQESEEKNLKLENPIEVIAGVDETFFNNMILILMDLSTGYIFLEEESDNRTYETWNNRVQKVVDKYGIKIKYFVSDRAKALIKLAINGFRVISHSDLFHTSFEVIKLLGSQINKKYVAISEKIVKSKMELELIRELPKELDKIEEQERLIEQLNNEYKTIESVKTNYHETLDKLSTTVHPFDINNNMKQTSADIRVNLNRIEENIKTIVKEQSIIDKQNRLKKISNQFDDIVSLNDCWWLWVNESLTSYNVSDDIKSWLLDYLLPTVYWKKQVEKTKNPKLKKSYDEALDYCQLKLNSQNIPEQLKEEDLFQFECWAEWIVSKYQRSSSAVEGRNGWLSQMNHNGRGFTPKRLKVLTVIHNFVIKRSDGTTAAERLFGKQFSDLFENILCEMGELPLPRKARLPYKDKVLLYNNVPG